MYIVPGSIEVASSRMASWQRGLSFGEQCSYIFFVWTINIILTSRPLVLLTTAYLCRLTLATVDRAT